MREPDLRHHGDTEAEPGLVDLAVNVRSGMPPDWLRKRLAAALDDVAAYPDARPAAEAVASRHSRPVEEVLPTAGGAEAFTLLARAFRPGSDIRRAVVVHPQFTEPEVALTTAGYSVERVVLPPERGFILDPDDVPDDADLVVVGNPTNPTSVLHPARIIERLARPGRVLVVDEAFMDAVPGEAESVTTRSDLPGLVVLRSLTKTWGLAGVRAGYVIAPAALIERLRAVQPPWSVSNLAVAAMRACMQPAALEQAERMARADEPVRQWFVEELRHLGGEQAPRETTPYIGEGAALHVVPNPRAPFVLVRFPDHDPRHHRHGFGTAGLRLRLRESGWAVRRGDTFPGLGQEWVRIALRDRSTLRRFLDQGLAPILSPG